VDPARNAKFRSCESDSSGKLEGWAPADQRRKEILMRTRRTVARAIAANSQMPEWNVSICGSRSPGPLTIRILASSGCVSLARTAGSGHAVPDQIEHRGPRRRHSQPDLEGKPSLPHPFKDG
jgi:hypothetical protein